MANKPITMNKIKQIIKSYAQGRGTKQISSLTGVARNTVKEYLKRFKATGLTVEEAEGMQDSALADLIIGNVDPVLDARRHEELKPLIPLAYIKQSDIHIQMWILILIFIRLLYISYVYLKYGKCVKGTCKRDHFRAEEDA
jgi:hypothetical protein